MLLSIIKKLNEISTDYSVQDSLYLGFQPGITEKARKKLLINGWWHTIYFGSGRGTHYGLRVLPEKKWNEWPVVATYSYNRSVIMAPNLKTFIPFIRFYLINKNKKIFLGLRQKWNQYENLILPIVKITSSQEDIAFFKDFLFNDSNIPAEKEDNYIVDRHVEFWNHYDKSPEHSLMREIISTMKKNDDLIPELPDENFGIWENNLLNIVAARALMVKSKNQTEAHFKVFKRAYSQPWGYDIQSINFNHLPNESYEPFMQAFSIAARIEVSHSNLYNQSPLYPSVKTLYKKGGRGYNGVEHLSAATLFNDEYKDSLNSWNALVSAAYWSGKNKKITLTAALEKAIDLCRQNNWEDALDVLNHQVENMEL